VLSIQSVSDQFVFLIEDIKDKICIILTGSSENNDFVERRQGPQKV
jgi:hypothetical protein